MDNFSRTRNDLMLGMRSPSYGVMMSRRSVLRVDLCPLRSHMASDAKNGSSTTVVCWS